MIIDDGFSSYCSNWFSSGSPAAWGTARYFKMNLWIMKCHNSYIMKYTNNEMKRQQHVRKSRVCFSRMVGPTYLQEPVLYHVYRRQLQRRVLRNKRLLHAKRREWIIFILQGILNTVVVRHKKALITFLRLKDDVCSQSEKKLLLKIEFNLELQLF